MPCGTVVNLIQKVPVDGEAWMRVSKGSQWLNPDGTIKMELMAEAVLMYSSYDEIYSERASRANRMVETYGFPEGFVTVLPV